jgi:uncharacterized membrane protein
MIEENERASTRRLIGEAFAQAADFAGSLLTLCRAEIGENVELFGRAAVLAIVAAVGLLVGAVFLLLGLVALLIAHEVSPYTALFTVGGLLALVSIALALKARSDFASAGLTPTRTIDQIRSFAKSTRQVNPDGS